MPDFPTDEMMEAFRDNLKTATSRQAEISAHTGRELAKEDRPAMYTIKIVSSKVTVKTGANRVENEIHALDIMSFVPSNDTHGDKTYQYRLMIKMSDQVRDWVYKTDPSSYSAAVYWVEYKGVTKVIDDQKGFYALTQRVELETDISLITP